MFTITNAVGILAWTVVADVTFVRVRMGNPGGQYSQLHIHTPECVMYGIAAIAGFPGVGRGFAFAGRQ